MFLFWTQQYIHMLCPSEDVAPSETVNKSIYWQKNPRGKQINFSRQRFTTSRRSDSLTP